MNSSKNSFSQGTSNNILSDSIITFKMNQNTFCEKEILKYYSGKLVWIFFKPILGTVNTLKEILNTFSSHIGILFSNIFKIIKLAHFGALESGPLWLFILKYGDQNDIGINVNWLVSAFFFVVFVSWSEALQQSNKILPCAQSRAIKGIKSTLL